VQSVGVVSKNVKTIPLAGLQLTQPLDSIAFQKTISKPVSCTGVGVHSNKPATLTLRPASAGSGYIFVRTDVPKSSQRIPARWDTVTDTVMCTKITNEVGVSISTIEHVIAALAGCGVFNALIEVDGPEVPIMDGSSSEFVDLIHQACVHQLSKPTRKIKILKPIEVKSGTSSAAFKPANETKYMMKFNANGRLNNQEWSLTFYPEQDDFCNLLSSARTFGFYEDAQHLWSQGMAQGASLENTIVIKDGQVMNEEGLRFSDEFIRHKMLDAIGDLALAGAPLVGHFVGVNSGHALNNQLLRAFFSDKTAWSY